MYQQTDSDKLQGIQITPTFLPFIQQATFQEDADGWYRPQSSDDLDNALAFCTARKGTIERALPTGFGIFGVEVPNAIEHRFHRTARKVTC
jgi:hypothetical protein